jgi:TetR/AcrR family transcriptional regulator, fatty acid metabolism regulator protein
VNQQQGKGAEGGGREGDRRHTILRAAIEVFARKGYHGCRIADVAREAGVAYGLVYHYFKNKDELLETVFETGWGGFVSRMRSVAEGEGGLEEKVRRIADVAIEAYRVDPRAVRVLILEIARNPSGGPGISRQHVFLDVIRLASEMFARAQESGEVRKDMDPMLAAALLFGAIEMGLTAFVSGLIPSKDPEALERAKAQIAETFLRGVLPGAATSPEGSWKKEKSSSDTSAKADKGS